MTITAKWSNLGNMDSSELRAMANDHLPKWLTLALVIAVAWELARIAWMLVPASPADDLITHPPPTNISGPASNTGSQANVRTIAVAHLFGAADATETVAVELPPSGTGDLPAARGSLLLKGTVTASDALPSFAIIADNSKQEKVYRIGDPVLPGTTLHEIYRDLVVLNQNGVLSKLELPKEFANVTSATRRTPTVNRAASNNRSIQTVVAQNVSKLADVIRPTPYFVGGQQQGYRVYPGRNRKQFAALGLRPGDLIKDIDGASLTDPKQAMTIFQNLGSADQVSVTVERNGQAQVLILKTSQLEIGTDE